MSVNIWNIVFKYLFEQLFDQAPLSMDVFILYNL